MYIHYLVHYPPEDCLEGKSLGFSVTRRESARTAAVELKTISGSKGFGKQLNMSIFTSYQRKTELRSTAESRDSLITTIEGIKESTVKDQASSTFVRQLD